MKIKAKLRWVALLPIALAVVVAGILFVASVRLDRAIDRNRAVHAVLRGVFELNTLTYEYAQERAPRIREQWEVRHRTLRDLLLSIEFPDPADRETLRQAKQCHREIGALFSEVTTSLDRIQSPGTEQTQTLLELQRWRLGQLLAKSHTLFSLASQLAASSETARAAMRRRAYSLVVVVVIVTAALLAIVLALVARSITQPIARLHEGTDIIGRGNLDFQLGSRGDDEIGDLSRAFDQMTGKLRAITVSRDDLAREVAERKKVEEALRTSEEFTRSWLNLTTDGVWDWNLETQDEYLSPRLKEIFGYADDELPNHASSWQKIIHPDDLKLALQAYKEHTEKGKPFNIPVRYYHKNGSIVWVICRGVAIKNDQGKYVRMVGTHTDITQLKQVEEEVQLFFSVSLDLLCIADFQGYFIKLSPAWSETLGWSQEELMAKPFIEFVHPEDHEATRSAAAGLTQGKDVVEFDNRYLCKDGTYRWLSWNARAVVERGWTIAAARDITERKRFENELQLAKQLAEAASRTKSQFLANMSHELRTPLNSVIGFANILSKNKAGSMNPQDRTYLERISANGKHLLDLINQVLDLSKVESGTVDLELASVNLAALVSEIIAQLDANITGRTTTLRAELPQPMAALTTDVGKLKQVIINLIANALKFTERGSVTVRVTVDEATRHPLRLDVIDTGIGIPRDKLGSIFEAFHQADASTTRKYGGTGLGLTISQSLCQLMNYRIEVASEFGKGSTFSVILSPGLVTKQLPATTPPQPPLTSRKPNLVLVIDDEADARQLLSHMIEECGCHVRTANSSEQGLHMARELKPDLITVDLLMPRMDGCAFLRVIKSDPELRDIPIVVVSVVAEESRGALFGAIDVLQKPVTREDLQRVLHSYSRGKILLIDDTEDDRRLIAAYLADEPVEIHTAGNGREALELLKEFTPDVVLLDLMMPEMDGFVFLDTLRRNDRYLNLPVVVITAKELTPEEMRVLRRQSQALIKKTGEISDELKRLINHLLHRDTTARSTNA